jgi:pimeloyl-ACP methyl ester carboxylesterase
MSKPTIVVIPGSFSASEFYHPTTTHLQTLGYPSVIVRDLPSASRRPPSPAATLADDAQFFNYLCNKLCAEGKDVVIVAHSYGGGVATDCVKGLVEKSENEKEGRGVVKGIIYLTALVPKVGDSLAGMFDGEGSLEFLKYEVSQQICSKLSLPRVPIFTFGSASSSLTT